MQWVNVDEAMALGTLALNDVIIKAMTQTATEAWRCLSLNGVWSLKGGTSGEEPIVFGVAHGDYTAAEIEEYLEQEGTMDKANKIAQEQTRRLVRRIGQLSPDDQFNEGRAKYNRLNWAMATGLTLSMWAWNKSDASPLTTGASIVFTGRMLIRWT